MGKGDWRRPTAVSEQRAANQWCATFGHRPGSTRCLTCGIDLTKTSQIPNVTDFDATGDK